MLKRTISRDEYNNLLEGMQALYQEHQDGTYALEVEEDPRVAQLQAKVSEFRENNITHMKRASQEESLSEQVHDLRTELEAIRAERDASVKRAEAADFEKRAAEVGKKYGLSDGALPDIVARARAAGFRLNENGAAIALDAEGNVVRSPSNAASTYSLGEWMQGQRKEGAAHLFKQPTGVASGTPRLSNANIVHDPDQNWLNNNFEDLASGKAEISGDE